MNYNPAEASFCQLPIPNNYFCGKGSPAFPLPQNILLFYRGGAFDPHVLNSSYSQSHHRYVAIFNLSEPLTAILDEAIVRIGEGEGLLILPYQYHRFIDEQQKRLSLAFITFTLQENPENPKNRKNAEKVRITRVTLPDNSSEQSMWQKSACRQSPYFERFRGRAFRYDERALAMLVELVRDYSDQMAETLPYRLALLLQQVCCEAQPQHMAQSKQNRLIMQMIQAVQSDLSQTIGNLSQSLGYSESYLRSHFKQAMGLPLGRFILELRLARAKKLLLESDWTVSRIAENCGYASPYAFSHSFKVHNRLSPKEYRRNVRERQSATEQQLFERAPQSRTKKEPALKAGR